MHVMFVPSAGRIVELRWASDSAAMEVKYLMNSNQLSDLYLATLSKVSHVELLIIILFWSLLGD